MENIKSAILAAQAVSDRWEVLHSTSVLLKDLSALGDHSRLAGMAKALARLQDCGEEMSALLADIGDECVALVLGDTAAQAAKDAADLATAKQTARKLGVAHTFCV